MMSLICADVQQRSDTRHEVLAERRRRLRARGDWILASATICGARTAARACAFAVFSTVRTRVTPVSCAACAATAAAFCREHDDSDLGARNSAGASHALGGGGIELAAVMLGNDQNFC